MIDPKIIEKLLVKEIDKVIETGENLLILRINGRVIYTSTEELQRILLILISRINKFSDYWSILPEHTYLFKNADPTFLKEPTRYKGSIEVLINNHWVLINSIKEKRPSIGS